MARGSDGRRPPAELIRAEREALFELLDRFPAQLRIEDLTGRLTRFEAEPTFGDSERAKESVAELVGFGLALRRDGFVVPTIAAIHFDLLLEGH
ncbi:MAG: hypothetical protein JSU06_00365 [Actinobacteria bacterium]|nr:hypothetical protein [Actinomycetota bacterium]